MRNGDTLQTAVVAAMRASENVADRRTGGFGIGAAEPNTVDTGLVKGVPSAIAVPTASTTVARVAVRTTTAGPSDFNKQRSAIVNLSNAMLRSLMKDQHYTIVRTNKWAHLRIEEGVVHVARA